MGDILWLLGAIVFVWFFVGVVNKLRGKKGDYSSSHYDRDELHDRLFEDDNDNKDNSNDDSSNDSDYDYDYDYDND